MNTIEANISHLPLAWSYRVMRRNKLCALIQKAESPRTWLTRKEHLRDHVWRLVFRICSYFSKCSEMNRCNSEEYQRRKK
jgi:hypothetical protein